MKIAYEDKKILIKFKHSGYADPKFGTQVKKCPEASLAEAKVWDFLRFQKKIKLEKGLNKGEGPDFGLRFEENKIWIEVVTPKLESALSVVEYKEGQSFSSGFLNDKDNDPHCSQLLSAISKKAFGNEKDNGREQYVSSERFGVDDSSPYIIAVSNQSFLDGCKARAPLDLPILSSPILKVCWGISSEQFLVGENVYYKKKNEIIKKNGTELDVGIFDIEKYSGISAILFCNHFGKKSTYVLLYNHNAKNPISSSLFEGVEIYEKNGAEVKRRWGRD